MRIWGISTVEIKSVFQLKLPIRNENDEIFEEYFYEMNRMILDVIGIQKITQINETDLIDLSPEHSLVDCHVLNLIKYFPNLQLPTGIKILDYSSLGHRNLSRSDIRFPIEFSRAVIRNIRFNRKFSPKLIWHWDDYGKSQEKKSINFGWAHQFVDTELIKKIARKFLNQNLNLFPEINNVKQNDTVLIISPPSDYKARDISIQVELLLTSSNVINKKFNEAQHIIIKQHRVSTEILPNSLQLGGRIAIVMNTPLSRVLPMEILSFGFENSFLISQPSSVLYSNSYLDFWVMPLNDVHSRRAYGLQTKRQIAAKKLESKWGKS